jgi:hypothetical protein
MDSTVTTTTNLVNASISLVRDRLILHRNWSSDKMISKVHLWTNHEDVEEAVGKKEASSSSSDTESEDEMFVPSGFEEPPGMTVTKTTERDVVDEDAMICSAKVSVVPSRKSGAPSSSRKQFTAIVYGSSPLKFISATTYNVYLVRSNMKELMGFYDDSFNDGKDAIVYGSEADQAKFFKQKREDLRCQPRLLFQKRFSDVVLDGDGDGSEPDIFRFVRYCYLEKGAVPLFLQSILSRVKGGMKDDHYDDWSHGVSNLFLRSKLGALVTGSFFHWQQFRNKSKKIVRAQQEKKRLLDAAVVVQRFYRTRLCRKAFLNRKRNFQDVLMAWAKGFKQSQQSGCRSLRRNRRRRTKTSAPSLENPLQTELLKRKQQFQKIKKGGRDFFCDANVKRLLPKSGDAYLSFADKRYAIIHWDFYATCPEYWHVARDFPCSVMDYVLKPCTRSPDCKNCKDMLCAHLRNSRLGQTEMLLAPQSPFLRGERQVIYSSNLKRCIEKWTDFAKFERTCAHFPTVVLQRMRMYDNIVNAKMKRGTTYYSATEDVYRELENGGCFDVESVIDAFHEEIELDPISDDAAVLERFFDFAKCVLSNRLLFSTAAREYMLSDDFLMELELTLILRDHVVYDGIVPGTCKKPIFPNVRLAKAMQTADDDWELNGTECIAFARRWTVHSLLSKIRLFREQGKAFVLHIDTSCPFFFKPYDNLQDWSKGILQTDDPSKPYYCKKKDRDCFPLSLKRVTGKPFIVSREEQLKEIMEKAASGECYVLTNNEKKRLALLKSSLDFRNDPYRRVLRRTFPTPRSAICKLKTPFAKDGTQRDEITVGTVGSVSVFGPRKDVYCVGDLFRDEAKKTVEFLATENLWFVQLDENMPIKYRLWSYNDKNVDYNNNGQSDWSGVPFSRGSFASIQILLDRCLKHEEWKRKKEKEQQERAKQAAAHRAEVLRKRAREMHGERLGEKRTASLAIQRPAKKPARQTAERPSVQGAQRLLL